METTQVCINQKVSFISPPPAERAGRQLGTEVGEQRPGPGLQVVRPAGGQEAREAAQRLEVWLAPEEPCSLRMGRVWRPEDEDEEETVGKRGGVRRALGAEGPGMGGRGAGGLECPGALPSWKE